MTNKCHNIFTFITIPLFSILHNQLVMSFDEKLTRRHFTLMPVNRLIPWADGFEADPLVMVSTTDVASATHSERDGTLGNVSFVTNITNSH